MFLFVYVCVCIVCVCIVYVLCVYIEDFNNIHAQQNMEQLNNFLKSLNELYEESHNRHIFPPNESEFRAYYILYQLDNEGEVINENFN